MTYAELHCHSNFSFLDGASHPEELVDRARELALPALALPDTNAPSGAVRFALPADNLPLYREIFGRDRLYLELRDHLAPDDLARNHALLELAAAEDLSLVVTNEVLYHARERHRLQDVLTAIRHRSSLDGAQPFL